MILIPCILLSAFGLHSLRQDTALADHEISSTAQNLAQQWNNQVLPQLLTPKTSSFERSTASTEVDSAVELPPDGELREFPSLLISSKEILLFPAPSTHWPKPQPIFELPQETQDLFQSAETAAREFRWPQALSALTKINSAPDASPHAMALARYRWALTLGQSGATTPARNAFQQMLSPTLALRSEVGIPLDTLAALQILQLDPTPAQAASAIDHAAFNSLRDPSPLTPRILEMLRETAANSHFAATPSSQAFVQRVDRWIELWQRHELLRTLAEPALAWLQERPAEPALKWLTNPLSAPVLLSARTKGDIRCGIWPLDLLRARLIDEQKARGWPEDCTLVLNIAGQQVLGQSPSDPSLATLSQGTAKSGWNGSIHLANPAQFYARQHARSRRYGVVIGLGLITVVIGFFNARRAYLRQAALAEMRTNFVSSVSHELRAPIAAVRLLSEELADLTPTDHVKASEYQSLILRECRRLSGLIENVLDFSRNEQGRKEYQFESIDLAALVRATSELMRIHADERSVILKNEIEEGAGFAIEADAAALQQVLVNLLDNAIKHSAPHSEITLKLRHHAHGVILEVNDQGEGIPATELPKIFERFYRCGSELTRRTPGVGLGLAIARYIVEAHRGTITAESAMGQGSTFTVRLPESPL